MRSVARLLFSFLSDFLLRKVGRKDKYLEMPSLLPSHYFPDDSLSWSLLEVSERYLLNSGWINSRLQRRSVDQNGSALPWLTYPSIAFLEQLDLEDKIVLEFGGGGSTAYFSRRSKQVHTVELDGEYLDSLRTLNLDKVIFFEWLNAPYPSGDFPSSIADYAGADASYECTENIQRVLNNAWELAALIETADLILIDGGPRMLYAAITAKFARATATVVIDNSDLNALLGIADLFLDDHFLKVPFRGLGPLNAYDWETTVLVPRTRVD